MGAANSCSDCRIELKPSSSNPKKCALGYELWYAGHHNGWLRCCNCARQNKGWKRYNEKAGCLQCHTLAADKVAVAQALAQFAAEDAGKRAYGVPTKIPGLGPLLKQKC